MTNKFKIGDEVRIIKELKNQTHAKSWYHENPMIIIAYNEWYYFTDYWHNKHKGDIEFFKNKCSDGITEECLEYSNRHMRIKKLERIVL